MFVTSFLLIVFVLFGTMVTWRCTIALWIVYHRSMEIASIDNFLTKFVLVEKVVEKLLKKVVGNAVENVDKNLTMWVKMKIVASINRHYSTLNLYKSWS